MFALLVTVVLSTLATVDTFPLNDPLLPVAAPSVCQPGTAVIGDTEVWPGVAGHQSPVMVPPSRHLLSRSDQQIAAWLYLYIFCNVLIPMHTMEFLVPLL